MNHLALFCLAVGLAAPLAAQSGPGVLVVSGGTLVDVASGKETSGSVIVISGQRIERVGTAADTKIPAGAQVVDARGRWIVPGLIDSHAHAGDDDEIPLGLYLANGVTTIRNPGGNLTLLRLTRERLLRGELVGPRLFFSGPLLDGVAPVFPSGSILVDTPERARSTVNFLADQGVDFVKVYNNVKEPELKAIVETAKQRGLPVAGHIPRSMTMTRAVEVGMTRLEHIRITGKEMLAPDEAEKIDPLPVGKREPLLWQRFDLQSGKFRALVQLLAQSRIFLDPTLVVEEFGEVADLKAESQDANNQYLRPGLVEESMKYWMSPMFEVPADLRTAAAEAFQKQQKFVGLCNQAGVRIIAGTDGPSFGKLLPGFALHHELDLLVASGLSPLQALQAATLTAAQALGKEGELGSIAPAKFADLLIVDADPLQQIQNLRRIHLVIQDGKSYAPDALLQEARWQLPKQGQH
jgi:imidazolonepropionase-like amidohydrolase